VVSLDLTIKPFLLEQLSLRGLSKPGALRPFGLGMADLTLAKGVN
jgi:hypothetical protein